MVERGLGGITLPIEKRDWESEVPMNFIRRVRGGIAHQEEKPLWRCHEFPACKRALDSLLVLNVLCVRLEAACVKRQSLLGIVYHCYSPPNFCQKCCTDILLLSIVNLCKRRAAIWESKICGCYRSDRCRSFPAWRIVAAQIVAWRYCAWVEERGIVVSRLLLGSEAVRSSSLRGGAAVTTAELCTLQTVVSWTRDQSLLVDACSLFWIVVVLACGFIPSYYIQGTDRWCSRFVYHQNIHNTAVCEGMY